VVGARVFVANLVGTLVPVGTETITAVESGLGVFVTVGVRVFRVRVGKGLVVAEGS
jgi:hypothetical protein